jgi:hypothetical protein
MDPAAIDEYLGEGGTGVLSLAEGDVPYSIPVSFGYDDESTAFYLRLGFSEGSEKRPFLERSAWARLIVYEAEPDLTSVVATGDLTRVPKDELTPETVAQLGRAELPAFDLWDRPKDELEFQIYRLAAEELSGRSTSA